METALQMMARFSGLSKKAISPLNPSELLDCDAKSTRNPLNICLRSKMVLSIVLIYTFFCVFIHLTIIKLHVPRTTLGTSEPKINMTKFPLHYDRYKKIMITQHAQDSSTASHRILQGCMGSEVISGWGGDTEGRLLRGEGWEENSSWRSKRSSPGEGRNVHKGVLWLSKHPSMSLT